MTTESIRRGTVLAGRYRLDDLLSENAGARFWKGTDAVLGRSVAVNVLPGADPRVPGLMAAARASATVTDSRLLRVLDCDDTGDIGWVVNEWGEGASLDVLLHQGPLPAARAAWLAREVAEMLSAAHARQIAHGRLAPEAVLITDTGAVKVIGFAVSAAIEGGPAVPIAAQRWGYGTPGPLESDVIDLAGVLYAGLTARWPGLAPSALPPAPYDARGPLRPRQVRAGVPRMLDAICERVLRKEAHEHLMPMESAFEVFAALTEHLGDPSTTAPTDLAGMHREPSVGLDRDRLRDAISHPLRVTSYKRQGSQGLGTGMLPVAMPLDAATLPADAAPPAATPAKAAPDAEDDTGALPAVAAAPPGRPAPPAPRSLVVPQRGFPGFDPDEEPAPLPPFVDSPSRPLFADTARAEPAPRPAAQPERPDPAPPSSTGWPFGDDGWADAPADRDGSPAGRPRRSWIRWAAVALLVLVVGIVATVALLGSHHDGHGRATAPPPHRDRSATAVTTWRPVSATDFDPQGRPPSENPGMVARAIDGDPSTGWSTSTYRSAGFGGLKTGVGLFVDLGADRRIGSVRVLLGTVPAAYSIYVSPTGDSTPPTSLAGLRKVGSQDATGARSTVTLGAPVRARYVVVWLTSIPKVGGGWKGTIDEVAVRS